MVKHTQFVGNLPTNCLSVFDHFVGLALKGLSFHYMGLLFALFHNNSFPEMEQHTHILILMSVKFE